MKKSELKQIIKEEIVKELFDTIKLTKEELITFMEDATQGHGVWSDTSYKILKFIGIDPTDGA
jgi:mevalonate pyrophosphate decarboxylase